VGSSVAPWVVLASPIVALVSSIVSAIVAGLAIRSNNRSQAQQRELQERMQQADLEERRRTDLRTERRGAYRTMGRITTTVDASKPYELVDLAEAHFEIEILTNSAEVQEAAAELYRAPFDARRLARDAWKARIRPATKDAEVKVAIRRMHELKGRFVDAARSELGLPPRPMQARYPLEIRQVILPSGAQESSEGPWWRRMFGE
jgi:type II secretory pathway pseudopilin PulG